MKNFKIILSISLLFSNVCNSAEKEMTKSDCSAFFSGMLTIIKTWPKGGKDCYGSPESCSVYADKEKLKKDAEDAKARKELLAKLMPKYLQCNKKYPNLYQPYAGTDVWDIEYRLNHVLGGTVVDKIERTIYCQEQHEKFKKLMSEK